MQKTTILKALYTAAAVALAGLLATHVLPSSFDGQLQMALTYLLLHSYLPSAKTGAVQG